jgi:hypothetical protein
MIRAAAALALVCMACGSTPDADRAVQRAPSTETAVAPSTQTTVAEASGMQNPDERIGQRIEPLDVKTIASDPRYGTTPEQPVRVGGGAEQGPVRTYGYLNALRGPNGEPVHYRRAGTAGDLVIYELTYGAAPIRLYVDWSRAEELRIPAGFLGR